MKRLLLILIACCVAIFLVNGKPPMEKHSAEYVAQPGETIDDIVGKWYHKDQRNVCWDEFRSENWKINASLQNGRRCLQPGDLVKIEWYEERR